MKLKVRYSIIKLDAVLIALVINANVLRFFLDISETNFVIDLVYIICVGYLLYKYKLYSINEIEIQRFTFISALIIFHALLSLLWVENSSYINFVKLIAGHSLFVLVYSLNAVRIRAIINVSLLINIIYGLVIILNPSKLDIYIHYDGVNYLIVTLTLGLSLSIVLVRFICHVYAKLEIKKIAFDVILSIFFFSMLTRFSSRGAILIPAIAAVIVILLIGIKRKSRFLLVLGIGFIFAYILFEYYVSHTSIYALSRMTSLFHSYSNEDRLQIWGDAIRIISEKGWFFWGGGIDAFIVNLGYYPHNYYIQIIGEYGLLGIALALYMTIYWIRSTLDMNNIAKIDFCDENLISSYVLFGASLYMLFTFCKSFSIYDAYPLYIMIALSIRSARIYTKSRKNSSLKFLKS